MKNVMKPFPSSDSKTKRILEMIHSNVCGPIPTSSLNGYLYYLTFVDDYSHKTFIYFLKGKDEVFNKFKNFKALVENLSEKKIKILRSNNGGEFTGSDFKSMCIEVGIKRELTIPYTHQRNSVAERKNKSIMEAVKAMLHDQDLLMYLWV